MRFYVNQCDYKLHDRSPDGNILDAIDVNYANKRLDDYFKQRFFASIEQHDVKTAFSVNKATYTREDLIREYGLNKRFPIVVVMAHIFTDAPHAYPDTLYDDYYEWIKKTIINIKMNSNVNFIVKEHPSSSLYNEFGILKDLLVKLEVDQYLLDDSVNTLSIINECDAVITCGGTIGLEFLYKGKQVVLAAKPPYSGFGLTTEFDVRDEYEYFLRTDMFSAFVLTKEKNILARKIVYYDFILLDNYKNNIEIGGQRYFLGRKFDYDKFYRSIIEYNEMPLYQQNIYRVLKKYVESGQGHMINEGRLGQ